MPAAIARVWDRVKVPEWASQGSPDLGQIVDLVFAEDQSRSQFYIRIRFEGSFCTDLNASNNNSKVITAT